MIAADAVRAVVLAALIVTMITDRDLGVAARWLALGLLATAEVFADNTSATLTPMLVHRDDLAIANSRLQTGFITLNQLVGPADRGGPVRRRHGVAVRGRSRPGRRGRAAGVAGRAARPRPRPDRRRRSSVRRDIAEGFRWTIHHAAVRTLSLTILIFNVTFGAAWSVLVLYAQQRLGLGAVGFGLLTTVSAVGGLLGHRRSTAGSPGG